MRDDMVALYEENERLKELIEACHRHDAIRVGKLST